MPITWNTDSDAALFKAVLTVAPLAQLDNEQRNGIVAYMSAKGFGDTTWEAVRQHLQKLKRTSGPGSGGPSTGTQAKKTTGRGKKRAKTSSEADDDDDEDDLDTPTKPAKKKVKATPTGKGKGKSAVSTPVPEQDEEDEDVKIIKQELAPYREDSDDDGI